MLRGLLFPSWAPPALPGWSRVLPAPWDAHLRVYSVGIEEEAALPFQQWKGGTGFCGQGFDPRQPQCRGHSEPPPWAGGSAGLACLCPAGGAAVGTVWERRRALQPQSSGCHSVQPSVEAQAVVHALRFLPEMMPPQSAAFSPPSHQFCCGGR